MKCEKCGKKEANTHYKEHINGHAREMHLCGDCAREIHLDASFGQAFAGLQSGFFGFPSLFDSGLSTAHAEKPRGVLPDTERRCSCGKTLRELRQDGRAGCAACYHTFADVLEPYIRRVQGADSHIGSIPQVAQTAHDPLESLKDKLQEAIKNECYEEAARLRDEIRRQEGA